MKSIIAAGPPPGLCTRCCVKLVPIFNMKSIKLTLVGLASDVLTDGSVVEVHKGYKGELGEKCTWFVQAGPAIVADGGMLSEFSGKVGAPYEVSEMLRSTVSTPSSLVLRLRFCC